MQIKLLQLNMWAGTHFPVIKDFLEKNDFDILCFQEVAGPNVHVGNAHSTEDQYKKLGEVLGATHNNVFHSYITFTSDPINSFEGNAIFFKKNISLLSKKEMFLYKGPDPYPSDVTSVEDMTRAAHSVTLSKDGKEFDVVTAHLAWARTHIEQPHQRKQNLKFIEYIRSLGNPWILAGDFNISPENQTILDLEKIGRDLTEEYHVENTIDGVNHVSWDRIKPGFPVDYIFVSPEIGVKDFKVLNEVHMSDHYGLEAEVEI